MNPDVETMSKTLADNAFDSNEKDDLYTQLWHACAGDRVYVPRAGEKVFYFPQGYMEQVKAYTNEYDDTKMPVYNLPSKILCKVVHVQLKAEAQTDEVFARITLIPEAKQDCQMHKADHPLALSERNRGRYFSKYLTPSDTSTHGGLSVPKRHADECFPPLDMEQQPSTQDLIAKDLHGVEWHFRHIYRGQPKRHLLTSGWSTFANSKKLVTGDSCIFVRGEDGELHVGIRRALLQHSASSSVISGHSMQHGILASAFHAILTGTMFTVYYLPWTTPSKFLVSYEQCIELKENIWSIGSKFQMRLEGDEGTKKRFTGTVLDIKDLDCIRWPKSEWRCLKVQWDTESDALVCPEKVSPWDIEPIGYTNKRISVHRPAKRTRELDSSSLAISILDWDDLFQGSFDHTYSEVLQGQENKFIDTSKSSAFKLPSSPNLSVPSISDLGCTPLKDQSILMYDRSFLYYGSKDMMVLDDKGEIEDPVPHIDVNDKYMLFGVNLVNASAELSSPQTATCITLHSSFPSVTSQPSSLIVNISENAKSEASFVTDKQCKNIRSVTSRSCIKVLKYGTALGRSVDLSRFDGYEKLICDLDQMFGFKGDLIHRNCSWHVTFKDVDGDTRPIGDRSWQDFRSKVQRLFICPQGTH